MTDTSGIEFSRYVSGIKFSAALAAVETFSTREPTALFVPKHFGSIGLEMGTLLAADRQYHVFSNPDLGQIHLLLCGELNYVEHECTYRFQLTDEDRLRWRLFTTGKSTQASCDAIESRVEGDLSPTLCRLTGNPRHVAIAPFCKADTPFGYFVFCWDEDQPPELLQPGPIGERLREAGIAVLNYVHSVVLRLVSNHYPIHRDTYIPTFQRTGFQTACILFADIRNFTSAFESGQRRMSDDGRYTRVLVGFVKAYLEASSICIAKPGVGRIDKFIGDGIMATFGEYLVCRSSGDNDEPASKARAACLLGLYGACVLHDAFSKLRSRFLEHPAVSRFLEEHNDVIDMRLGVGMNYGEVMFDYFGSQEIAGTTGVDLISGYAEYTAIGDHVNAAQRLESLASKPSVAVSLLERGPGRLERSEKFIAPTVMSRTVFRRLGGALHATNADSGRTIEEQYRSSFTLKGKGSAVEAYEVFPDEVNGDNVLRTLEKLIGTRLVSQISPNWNDRARRFEFSEDFADELSQKYFPSNMG